MFEGNRGDYARGKFDGSVVCTIRSQQYNGSSRDL